MIAHRLFVKGESIYALLSSHMHPNILIPVKATVKDVKFDDVNPQYIIKVTKFYDSILFLKKYLFDMSFSSKFNKRARTFSLNPDRINNKEELIEAINTKNESSYYFVIDSIMTCKYRGEMVVLFNKIQNHLIEKRFRENREMMTRIFYSGTYKLTGDAEFEARLKKFVGDKIEESGISLGKYFRLL
jgi:hypothetical protein